MNYIFKNAVLNGIPRPNQKGEYVKLQGTVVFESTDGKQARIVKRVEDGLTDAEKKVIDGIHARFAATANELLKEVNA